MILVCFRLFHTTYKSYQILVILKKTRGYKPILKSVSLG